MSAEVLREVRLHGVLAKKFGKVHRLAVQSAAEAVQALCVVLDGFEAHLRKYSAPGYHVFVGRRNIGEQGLPDPAGDREVIRIVPVVVGSKRAGALQTIVGAVLVVAGWFFANPYLVASGVSMMLGGVIQMLSPQPKPKESDTGQSGSYSFSSIVNTITEGGCVPLAYGRVLAGSTVISGGIRTSDIPIDGVVDGVVIPPPLPAWEPDPYWDTIGGV